MEILIAEHSAMTISIGRSFERLPNGLLLFRSRKLWKIAQIAQGLSEEAQCIQGAILNSTTWFLHCTFSGGRVSCSRQFINLLVSAIYVQSLGL